jgi:hypothetical protein
MRFCSPHGNDKTIIVGMKRDFQNSGSRLALQELNGVQPMKKIVQLFKFSVWRALV